MNCTYVFKEAAKLKIHFCLKFQKPLPVTSLHIGGQDEAKSRIWGKTQAVGTVGLRKAPGLSRNKAELEARASLYGVCPLLDAVMCNNCLAFKKHLFLLHPPQTSPEWLSTGSERDWTERKVESSVTVAGNDPFQSRLCLYLNITTRCKMQR